MKTSTRIWLTISAILIAVGIGVIVVALAMNHWNLSTLGGQKTVTNNYEFHDNIENISIDANTTDIVFLPSDNGNCKVECYEREKQLHEVTLSGGTLYITAKDERKWYENVLTFSFSSPEVKIYLPKDSYDRLDVKCDTGDVTIPKVFSFYAVNINLSTGDISCHASATKLNLTTTTGKITLGDLTADTIDIKNTTGNRTLRNVTAEDITLNASTGDTTLTNVTAKALTSKASTGDLTMNNVIVENKFTAKTSTGHVRFTDCDAAEISIRTDTGKVSGTLLSEKVFHAKSDTGKIDVPKTITGGLCEIETDTGNISVKVK